MPFSFFVICKAEAREICFCCWMRKIIHGQRKSTMMKGDEGRTRAKVLDQRWRRKEVFEIDFFSSQITQNVSFFYLEERRRESRDMW